jgi:iron complex outermembrane recepter protein
VAFSSPFEHALLRRISGTVDWYEARVTDPIEVQQTSQIVNSCYNVNGLNPGYSLSDPEGFCGLIERDPTSGAIVRVYNTFGNQGKLVIRGVDMSVRWTATMEDLGLASLPGTLSVSVNGNFLVDQIQRYGAAGTDDFAGFGGASRIRANTGVSYNWSRHRVQLTWQYRQGTQTASNFATTLSADQQSGPNLHRNPIFAGYHTSNMFNATVGSRFGKVNASVSINNLLNTKPQPGGYDLRDPRAGFGNFSPFDDLVGRRYSLNLSLDL